MYIVHAMKSCLSHSINNCRWRQVFINFVIRLKYSVFVIDVSRFVTLTAFICVCFTLSFLVVQLLFQRNSYFPTLKYFLGKYGCYQSSFFLISPLHRESSIAVHLILVTVPWNTIIEKMLFFLDTLLPIWSDIWTHGDALKMQFWIDVYEASKKHFFLIECLNSHLFWIFI